jgi:hypothetical protein
MYRRLFYDPARASAFSALQKLQAAVQKQKRGKLKPRNVKAWLHRTHTHYTDPYVQRSVSFRTEFFALLQNVDTTPAASGVIPKVSWSSAESQLSVRIVFDATLAFTSGATYSAISVMADFREKRACIKFCFKLGKTAIEYYEILKTAFGEQALGRSQTFQRFSRFKAKRTSIDDEERSGRPVSSSTPEIIEIVSQIIARTVVVPLIKSVF